MYSPEYSFSNLARDMRRVLFSAKSYTRTRFDLHIEEVVDIDALVGIVELRAFLVPFGATAIVDKVYKGRVTLKRTQKNAIEGRAPNKAFPSQIKVCIRIVYGLLRTNQSKCRE